MGTQYALTIALFTWGGYWIDSKFDTSPLFVLLGFFLGFAGGTASLIYGVLGSKNNKS